jgi:hypothetical protein
MDEDRDGSQRPSAGQLMEFNRSDRSKSGASRFRTQLGALLVPTGLAAVAILVGCVATPTPRFASGEDAALTRDGLRLVELSGFQRAWVRPGVSFTDYHGIRLHEQDIAYRQPPGSVRDRISGNITGNYSLTNHVRTSFSQYLVQIFAKEFGESELDIVEETGPGVLDARVGLVNLVIRWPLDFLGGEYDHYVDSIGAVSIRVDLHDSVSGELIARVAERAEIDSGMSRPVQVSAGTAIHEVRRLLSGWATRLRLLLQEMQADDLA